MRWKERRKLRKDGLMAVTGNIRLKYIEHLLPDILMIVVDGVHLTMQCEDVISYYGEYFVQTLVPRNYGIEVTLGEK